MNRYFRGVIRGVVPRTGQKWVKPGRSRSGPPTLVRVSGVSGRVLVVDDNKVIRQLIRVNLELEGFEVVTAADGAECLDVVHRVRPDVVTLDVVMPRLDGIRTAERLRADPRTSHLPVAIISPPRSPPCRKFHHPALRPPPYPAARMAKPVRVGTPLLP